LEASEKFGAGPAGAAVPGDDLALGWRQFLVEIVAK
jgi:hypothetical protein